MASSDNKPIRALEFFSGIGGLHYGFNLSGVPGEVVASFDVNTVGNDVYMHNFKKVPNNTSIDTLSVQDIEGEFLSLSQISSQLLAYESSLPGRQLETQCLKILTGGKLLDDQDPRAKALLHLIDIIHKLSQPPEYVFLENVLNFETSRSRTLLLTQLDSLSYTIYECLLSPLQFGIANDRLRYYLMARRRATESFVELPTPYLERAVIYTQWPFEGEEVRWEPTALESVLELGADEIEELKVPEKDLLKSFNFRFAGSILQTKQLEITSYDFTNPSSLLPLGLRFFSPLEVARLHAFPVPPSEGQLVPLPQLKQSTAPRLFRQPASLPHLEFPDTVTTIQKHRLLGNSLNCWVVAELLRCVLFRNSIRGGEQ
ncbi:hypothetical protein BC937DRAFT_86585 [Endogone sp. FLAS-F59071]|nr:hypothetical protein BC937DRAFT_86585 [Endogone sp. FLAS-F59071]|eukprot:RUS20001.1 hypothetical protein BC937DRAFT_86585 [Endogone sp. FLAS-F59071]